jgi:hypothetical protein
LKTKLIIFIGLIAGVFAMSKLATSSHQEYRYIITETSGPSSFDPLDGDQTNNLSVQRMIYATPLEVDQKGILKSLILKEFSYDPKTFLMTWIVKDDQKYSDGTKITADDVAFAVARMAQKRPHFPVIEEIKGVQEWSQQENALASFPLGIKVDQNKVEIQFLKSVDHPLFRFCLEVFSVIPKSCVDTKTNVVTCSKIPYSGHYQITNQSESQVQFKLRSESNLVGQTPDQIKFEYLTAKSVFSEKFNIDGNTVIQGNEIKLSLEQHQLLSSKFKTSFLPSARIALNLLNPNIGAFKNRNCRLIFADAYRTAFSKIANSDFKVESSIFTEVLPGYKNTVDLKKNAHDIISEVERSECLSQLKQNPPLWAQTKDETDAIFRLIAEKTFEILGIEKPTPVKLKNRKEETEAFAKGEISLMGASTGFWALDPAGDIQMLLTPNMHKLLQFVSNDDRAQKLIKDLKSTEGTNAKAFSELNQYIFDDAKFNVFAHVRRFYAAQSLESMAELPVSITSPAPWQVFRMK